ncbi:hypothetical protein FHP25_03690 [Vineibacter terrae]|uniref:Uncharacterized protein n=1 Tax=Vineibacter terrae TaxID=2586908 RepID=A0A5C8PTF9_9HYPH|nr:hypothetical protein FHP25_03690 [Vineibacter terrae]
MSPSFPAGLYGIHVIPSAASGRRHLDAVDQITPEFAGVYRRSHACPMRTIPPGLQHRARGHAALGQRTSSPVNAFRRESITS